MIIPSIDLMGGKAVQLRQGRELVLTSSRDPVELAREFNRYGEVAVIDLDAAMQKGDNLDLIRRILKEVPARVGGGIRDPKRGEELLRAGATALIIGTAAEEKFLKNFPKEKVMVALDHKQGKVVDQGWVRPTKESVLARATRLKDFCGGFLVTFVEDEGGMKGINMPAALDLQRRIAHPLVVAGGVAAAGEAAELSRAGLDVQVGMALYSGQLDLAEAVVQSLNFEKADLLPTIVQDEAGRVLMLAFSSKESLTLALREGRGIYYSRSRRTIWKKGETSGHIQELISCRADCDRDTLLFTVRQNGPVCHNGTYTCFGHGRFALPDLYRILKERKRTLPEGSYSARLFGDRKYLIGKIKEETQEVISAKDRRNLVWEIADILYMLSVLAVDEGIDWSEIEAELGGRQR